MPSFFTEFLIFIDCLSFIFFLVCHTLLSVFGLAFIVYTFSCLSFLFFLKLCGDLFLSKLVCCDIFHLKLLYSTSKAWLRTKYFLGMVLVLSWAFSSNLYLTVFNCLTSFFHCFVFLFLCVFSSWLISLVESPPNRAHHKRQPFMKT